jgi:hypothetical protein
LVLGVMMPRSMTIDDAGDPALYIGKLAVTLAGCGVAFALEAIPFGLIPCERTRPRDSVSRAITAGHPP